MESTVRRTSRSYVRPAADTPSGSLELSAVDRVVGMRHMVRSLHVFRPRHRVRGEEEDEQRSPARVVREALAKALVDYYPFAGRLVDGAGGPATARVECTGEGAWFVEAVAACSLEDVAFLDHHPFGIPADDLLPDAAPGVQPVGIPLMMQVTEFTCGGFVVGLSSSHTLTDGLGAGQFINAIADYARGLPKPRVSPIWARELVPSPRKLLHLGPSPGPPTSQFRYLTVDLTSDSVDRVRSQFHAATGQRCSTFDVAVAKVWQARTRSLRLPDPSVPVTLCFFANARHVLPKDDGAGAAGFYGNCFYPVTVTAEAGAVERADVAGVVGIVRDAKAQLATEFARWAAGELAEEEDPYELWWRHEPLFVSDWRRLGFLEADYGWGTPLHVAPLAALQFMPVALIVAPPTPRMGVRIQTQCVEEEHMPAFREEMKAPRE
ncbi:hypothetical protein SEVIR_5G030000v4 [Setaria viridis]|uniref:Uncharacterized protein n=1 Tax=Setaria viridis TaxID=4556 RepID=A0A4U6UE66_SETVI|nr:acyl transferase 4-like [Setaria viridis]TKW12343.1 hypothetical protein SEVIR_5G030000v2 [Setaria viridis]